MHDAVTVSTQRNSTDAQVVACYIAKIDIDTYSGTIVRMGIDDSMKKFAKIQLK